MAALPGGAARTLAAIAALALLAGCSRTVGDSGRLSWAKAALERNPDIEVVSVNRRAGTVTVRLRDSGQTRVVRASQVIGTLPRQPGATAGPVAEPGASGGGQVTVGPEAMDVAAAAGPASDSAAPAPSTPAASAAQAFSGDMMPADDVSSPAPAPAAPATLARPALRPGERVVASGPGYSIVATEAGAPGGAAASPHTRVTDAALERMHGPIVCDGSRLLNIDNRNLTFPGNAITAAHGCEIHISNSRIAAGGVGILARGASVHVENSQIIGRRASIEALDGAQVYVETSIFQGPRRRRDDAAIHDLGDNTWE
jgi:hypothetical protein